MIRNNYRDAECCAYCKHEIYDFEDCKHFCNLNKDFPGWGRNVPGRDLDYIYKWMKEHMVGEYSICDNFDE